MKRPPPDDPDVSPWQGGLSAKELMSDLRAPVGVTPDLRRVSALPVRVPPDLTGVEGAALAEWAVRRFGVKRAPGTCTCTLPAPRGLGRPQCIERLFPIQAWALYEAVLANGLVAPITVGGGKCLDGSVEFFDYASACRRSVAQAGAVEVATYESKTLHVASAAAFPSGAKPCVRLVLKDGTEIIASTDHPILTARGWVKACDVLPSDYVAQATLMPEPKAPTIATDDEVALVAFLLSDGGVSQSQASFTNETPSVIAEFQRLASSVCAGWTERPSKSRARQFSLLGGGVGGWSENVAHTFRDKWDLHGLAKDKRLHASLWGLPRAQVALFLNRFWACDGHISKRGVEITLASEHMIDDLRFMLLRLGVRSRKRHSPKKLSETSFDAWTLDVRGEDAVTFLREVGDVLGKEVACTWLRDRLHTTCRNTNTDIVPISLRQVMKLCDELGLQARGGDPRTRGPGRPRTEIVRFLGATKGQLISRRKFHEFCVRWSYVGSYAHLATKDVAWQAVRDVSDAGVRPVYDLTVPGTHNFVANGVIVHNTVIDVMAALAVPNCKIAVLLVPPGLRDQLYREYEALEQHWTVPSFMFGPGKPAIKPGMPVVHVVPYSLFSRPESTDILERLAPDLIIADEAHSLRNYTAARTARILRYFLKHPNTRLCAWSGTLVAKSVKDCAHLFALALRALSPLPLDPAVVEEWALAIDPGEYPAPPGALERFGLPVREGLNRRIVSTVGVVASTGASISTPLRVLDRVPAEVPFDVAEALEMVRGPNKRPDGADLVEDTEIAACAQELACGFYHRWRFPRGEPEPLILEWYAKRKSWAAELRDKLGSRREHLDSPRLCQDAAERFHGDRPKVKGLPEWGAYSWPDWRDIKDLVKPETGDAVWVNDWLARDAAEWARSNHGVVWCQYRAFRYAVARLAGVEQYGGGPRGGGLLDAKGNPIAELCRDTIVLSMRSHGTGRDGLQYHYSESLFANTLSNGQAAEQVLGRLHRTGQRAAEVTAWKYGHTAEVRKAWAKALEGSAFISTFLHPGQKLIGALADKEDGT